MTSYLDPILARGVGGGKPLADQGDLFGQLAAGLTANAAVLILVGKSGTGKSTLLRSLQTNSAVHGFRCLEYRAFSDLLDEARFATSLAYEFGLRSGGMLAKLGMALPGQPVQPSTISAPHAWSEYELAELVAELTGAVQGGPPAILRVDQCERASFAPPEDIITLRGMCRAASKIFRLVLAVRQDALGQLLDALDGSLSGPPKLVFVPGLTMTSAEEFAKETLLRAKVSGFSEDDIRHLVGALESGGYVWPVALNAVLEEVSLGVVVPGLLDAASLNPQGIAQLLARSVQRRLTAAPAGLSDECYWTLRAIARGEQSRKIVTERSLVAASAVRDLDELRRVLDHLVAVRLVVSEANGGWRLAHEAIFHALQQVRGTDGRPDDTKVFDVVERWQASGRLTSSDAEVLLGALRTSPTLPLAALVLLAASLAIGIAGDLPGTLTLLGAKLRESSNDRIEGTVRALHARVAGQENQSLYAALLYSGTSDGVRRFLNHMARSSAEQDWAVSANVERLLMGVPAKAIEEAIEENDVVAQTPLVAASVMRVALRRTDVNISIKTSVSLVESVRGLDPGLAMEIVWRFDLAALGIHCDQFLRSPKAADKVAALLKLSDAPSEIIRGCMASINALLAGSEAMVRRRVLALMAMRPEIFSSSLRELVRAEPSPLLREGVLEVIRPEHPEAGVIIAAACEDAFDFVRESAVYAAGRCELPRDKMRELLVKAVKDPSEKVREAAVRISQRFGLRLPLEEILTGLRSHQEALLSAFMSVLEAETSDDIDLALADLAMDSTLRRDIRLTALARLGERGGEVAVWSIATLLAEADPEVVATAIVSAQMTADARHVDQLARLSRHPLAAIRERVIYAVAEIGGERAVDVCLGLLLDPIAEIRERAVYALLRLGAATHLTAIERALQFEKNSAVLAALAEARKVLTTS